jgi:MYXO-CTERM domain-containing protein
MTEAELKACQPTKPGTGYPTESPTGDDEGPTAPWANPITWLFGAMVAGLFAFISRRRDQDTTTR